MQITKLTIIVTVLCITILPVAAQAQEGPLETFSSELPSHRIAVEPYVQANFGYTNYVLKATGVRSELEFPLNTLFAGGKIAYAIQDNGLDEWLFQLKASTSLLEPRGELKDHDWYVYAPYPDIKFSYTESDAVMNYLDFSLSAEKRLYSLPVFHLYGATEYSLQYIDQDAMGYTGWQYVQDPNTSQGDNYPYGIALLNSDVKALDYTVIHQRFGIGARMSWRPSYNFEVKAALMPQLLYVEDEDDHVLRNKLSTAEGFGFAGKSELSLTYTWGQKSTFEPYVSLQGQFNYMRANIDQTQEWYGDDGATPTTDDTGTKITGITHIIESIQGGVSISAGIWYTFLNDK